MNIRMRAFVAAMVKARDALTRADYLFAGNRSLGEALEWAQEAVEQTEAATALLTAADDVPPHSAAERESIIERARLLIEAYSDDQVKL